MDSLWQKNNLQQQDLKGILTEVQLISLYPEKNAYLSVYHFTHTFPTLHRVWRIKRVTQQLVIIKIR